MTSQSPGTARTRFVALLGVMLLAGFGLLCACGSHTDAAADARTVTFPAYYPHDYASLVQRSRNEGGRLVIYSNLSQRNWAPVFRAFQAKYPWVRDVSANNLNSDEVFQRALSEQATGRVRVDLLVSNATRAWVRFASREGTLTAYDSPELQKLPAFARALPNVFVMSTDPMLLVYNSALMKTPPTGIASLARIVSANPKKFDQRVEVRDPASSFGFVVNHAFLAHGGGDAWSTYERILPLARPETSSGTMIEKLISGEYLAGFPISSSVLPMIADSGGLVRYVYPRDGTVVLPRGIGIAAGAPHPATARLFLDFVLSAPGQAAVAQGGLTAYRAGVDPNVPGTHTYQEILRAVGRDHIIFAKYTLVPTPEANAFLGRFYRSMGR